jgi:hypothetical protein
MLSVGEASHSLTALCGGGASGPQPGVEANISFNGTSVAAGTILLGLAPELAAIIAVTVAGTVLAVDSFCASDPPADPGITDADFAAVKNPLNPAAFATAAGRLKDWYLNQYWHSVCECTGAATPPPPTPSLPGPVGTNTGLPTGTATQPCWDVTFQANMPATNGTVAQTAWQLWNNPGLLNNGVVAVNAANPAVSDAFTIPAGVTQLHWEVTGDAFDSGGANGSLVVGTFPSAGSTGIEHRVFDGGASGFPLSNSGTYTIPAGETLWNLYTSSAFLQAHTWKIRIYFYCSGQNPINPQTPCCPPDPLVQEYLQLIVNLLSNQYTAPANAPPPTSWSDGVRHSGLSGAGTITINPKTIGLRLEVTTPPAGVIIQPGSPNFYWNMGFITPIALTSPLRGQRLVFLKESFALPEFSDQVGYTLLHGTVADAVELLPVVA